MTTALIVTAGMGGNLPPMLGIGRSLMRRGWTVIVHADEATRPRAEKEGFTFVLAKGFAYDPAEDRSTLSAFREIPRFWADRGRGHDAVAVARATGADVALVDVLLVGALAELERAGVATTVVVHSTWEGVQLWLGGPLGALGRLRGVAPLPTVARADRVLVASDARLARPQRMPANVRITGPVLEEPPSSRPGRSRPLVLASLSTVHFPGQHETMQHLLDALAPLPVDVAAGSGNAVDPVGLRAGANTTLTRLVDHAALMPEASAVVSHGGHATTVRALAHGLPMLFVPMHPMMDQPRIARAVAAAGAGLVVSRTASPELMRAAMQRLLQEPSFRRAAQRLGDDFVAVDGAARAADEVEALVGARSPA